MRLLGPVGVLLVFILAGCSGVSSKQEAELVENGYTAMAGGDYYTAEHLLNQALAINDKNPYALLNLGVIYQETQRYDKARKFYQSVIDLDPSEKAAATNVQGYAGKSLADIARINMANLPPSAAIDSIFGHRSDTDGDGVPDGQDQCDGTPSNAIVSANGCWTLMGIFPSGKTDIGIDAHEPLNKVKMILEQNPSMRIEIQGHTDNTGAASANKRLSEKRAQSVMQYLIEQGVKPERLQWAGYGHTRPIASNKTAKGRKQNRRVELHPIQ